MVNAPNAICFCCVNNGFIIASRATPAMTKTVHPIFLRVVVRGFSLSTTWTSLVGAESRRPVNVLVLSQYRVRQCAADFTIAQPECIDRARTVGAGLAPARPVDEPEWVASECPRSIPPDWSTGRVPARGTPTSVRHPTVSGSSIFGSRSCHHHCPDRTLYGLHAVIGGHTPGECRPWRGSAPEVRGQLHRFNPAGKIRQPA